MDFEPDALDRTGPVTTVHPIRSVLLHVDATPTSLARARVAVRLAKEHQASLTVMQATFLPQPDWRLQFVATTAEPGPDDNRLTFSDAAERAIFDRADWVGGDPTSSTEVFCHHAMYADLLVLGHATPTADLALRGPEDFLPAVLRYAGRPAFVLPSTPRLHFGRRVLIGWDASASAARAVSAAMPWLRSAGHVHVLDGSAVLGDGSPEGGQTQIAAFLRCHGLSPTVQRLWARRSEVGDALLSRARSLRADLLVMGAQGHSRGRARLGRCHPDRDRRRRAGGVHGALTERRGAQRGTLQPPVGRHGLRQGFSAFLHRRRWLAGFGRGPSIAPAGNELSAVRDIPSVPAPGRWRWAKRMLSIRRGSLAHPLALACQRVTRRIERGRPPVNDRVEVVDARFLRFRASRRPSGR